MPQNPPTVALAPVIQGDVVTAARTQRARRDIVLLHSDDSGRSVALSPAGQQRQRKRAAAPTVSISPEDAQRVIDAAESQRDRLLLMLLWQTGARVSEALALTGGDIEPDALWLRNLKNGPGAHKLVPLPAGSTLAAELALYQKAQRLDDSAYLFQSRQATALSRAQAWRIVKSASQRASVTVRALRDSKDGNRGDKVPVWSHVFRHSRALQTLRHTDAVTAQQVLGHANLATTSRYLRYSQDELKRRVQAVPA